MKKTIGRLVYNTDTATLVAKDGNHMPCTDFNAVLEKLYISPKGNWFLHGWGGALTEYADHYGNRASDGDRIVPMTEDEALAWCEEHGAQEAIDQHFSHLIEEA